MSRRTFLGVAGTLVAPSFLPDRASGQEGAVVNDVHSQLNETRVRRVLSPRTAEEVQAAVRAAASEGTPVSICGSRHAMGGQQFGADTLLLDLRALSGIGALDTERGLIDVDAGVEWPTLFEALVTRQRGRPGQWGIAQKQTGADRLTIAGAISANAHGRGLRMAPFVGDLEAIELVDARGDLRRCSRTENQDLFQLAVGGYGLFGAITSATIRLVPRRKLQRVVEVRPVDGLVDAFDRRIADGFLYGDFQYAVDARSDAFMRRGVFSCYRPVDAATPIDETQEELSDGDWRTLLHLAHVDPSAAFDRYAAYYLSTSGRIYWSDVPQLSTYLDGYHRTLDTALGGVRATEMISELYVPRAALEGFFEDVRAAFRRTAVPIVYGTVRLIEKDSETFLPWAREPWACTIVNLHVEHTASGIDRAADAFRTLIDLALRRNGSYFLTYHRWARRDQVEAAHPRFVEFMQQKIARDPEERFRSDWWRHYRDLFADRLSG